MVYSLSRSRAGVIEPLAKAGQLRVVVATMGLAAGINFSLRSVALAAESYRRDQAERIAAEGRDCDHARYVARIAQQIARECEIQPSSGGRAGCAGRVSSAASNCDGPGRSAALRVIRVSAASTIAASTRT